MLMTKELPLPQRYAGGYLYADQRTGVLHTHDEEKPLPMEVITSKGGLDFEARETALAELALAPIGALYEVTRECRPDEDSLSDYESQTYRKTGRNEWQLID